MKTCTNLSDFSCKVMIHTGIYILYISYIFILVYLPYTGISSLACKIKQDFSPTRRDYVST